MKVAVLTSAETSPFGFPAEPLTLEGVERVSRRSPDAVVLPVRLDAVTSEQIEKLCANLGIDPRRLVVVDWFTSGTEWTPTGRAADALYVRSSFRNYELKAARTIPWPVAVEDFEPTTGSPECGFTYDLSARFFVANGVGLNLVKSLRQWNAIRTKYQPKAVLMVDGPSNDPKNWAARLTKHGQTNIVTEMLSARAAGVQLDVQATKERLEAQQVELDKDRPLTADAEALNRGGYQEWQRIQTIRDGNTMTWESRQWMSGDQPLPEGVRHEVAWSMQRSRMVVAPSQFAGCAPASFYRAASAGRVPVLLCKGAQLPFADEIDYGFAFKLTENDAGNLAFLTKTFISQRPDDKIKELGAVARAAWENYFSPARWPALLPKAIQRALDVTT